MTMIDDSRSQLQPHLRPGDTLIWSGRPDASVRFSKADVYLIPFSVFFAGFAVFWLWGATRGNAPWPFALFGVPFVAVGLWLLVGRFFYKAHRSRRTAYGLTATKAYISIGRSNTELSLRTAPMTVTTSRDGSHITVELVAAAESFWSRGLPFTTPMNTGAEFIGWSSYTRAFYDVADVDGLKRALDQIAASDAERRWR